MKAQILIATGLVALTVQISAWLAAPVITQRYVRLQHVEMGKISTDAGAVGQGQSRAAAAQPGPVATVLHSEKAR